MYFPSLEGLKDSNNFNIDEVVLFDALLFGIYEKGYHKRFNPRVYHYFDVELNEEKWISLLDWLVQVGLLRKFFELCSPFSEETIEVYTKFDDIPLGSTVNFSSDEEDFEPKEHEFEVSTENIFITYSFTELLKPLSTNSSTSQQNFFRLEGSEIIRDIDLPSVNLSKDWTLALQMQLYPSEIIEDSLNHKRIFLTELLTKVSTAQSAAQKGDFFEQLAEETLGSPYLKLQDRDKDYSTGEVDLIYKVSRVQGTLFENFSYLLLVECKNWNAKVGASEIRVLASKMKDFDSKIGIFVASKGITGDAKFINDATGILRNEWQSDRRIIITLALDEISEVVSGKRKLYELLERKYYEIRTV